MEREENTVGSELGLSTLLSNLVPRVSLVIGDQKRDSRNEVDSCPEMRVIGGTRNFDKPHEVSRQA